MDYQEILKNLKPDHEFIIGIDSDGCVFDSMEVKQKEFFIPNALKYFDLFPVSKILRETWEFVNLYSVYRGGNRFPAILKVFELLAERTEIKDLGYKLPDLAPLKEWVNTETKLSNDSLRRYYNENNDNRLEAVLTWSETVNMEISEWLHGIPPFFHAVRSLEKICSIADIIVVSQTPIEALENEWIENDLKKYVKIIAAQEHGTKTEHLALAALSKYPAYNILMIGDAIGDLDAAKNNGVLFYPIIPGNEDNSWERFLDEGLEKFLSGNFRGSYEESLLRAFKKSLPENPPW
jgi:phosphoglycolate phosphatase-like HAD superfamily hydrolase